MYPQIPAIFLCLLCTPVAQTTAVHDTAAVCRALRDIFCPPAACTVVHHVCLSKQLLLPAPSRVVRLVGSLPVGIVSTAIWEEPTAVPVQNRVV